MKDATVGARYARALFLVTEKRGETVRALEDLKQLWLLFKPGTRIGTLLATPQILLADKRQTLRLILEGKVARSLVLFIDLLLRKKRLAELETVVREYEALVEKQQGIQRAQVVSAVPMTNDEIARLHTELERRTQSKIRLTTEIDSKLVGGALVRIGDRVWDRSVQTLLEQISRQLAEVSV